jgi:hypothetical protein
MQIIKHEFKYGTLKLKSGARVKVPIGKGHGSVTVGDKTRHPGATFSARCVTCRRDFENEAELVAAHPPLREMVENQEVHVWAYFSAQPASEPEAVPEGASKDERKAIEARNAAIPQIGLVSDEPW